MTARWPFPLHLQEDLLIDMLNSNRAAVLKALQLTALSETAGYSSNRPPAVNLNIKHVTGIPGLIPILFFLLIQNKTPEEIEMLELEIELRSYAAFQQWRTQRKLDAPANFPAPRVPSAVKKTKAAATADLLASIGL